jgi:hypothetical protein
MVIFSVSGGVRPELVNLRHYILLPSVWMVHGCQTVPRKGQARIFLRNRLNAPRDSFSQPGPVSPTQTQAVERLNEFWIARPTFGPVRNVSEFPLLRLNSISPGQRR